MLESIKELAFYELMQNTFKDSTHYSIVLPTYDECVSPDALPDYETALEQKALSEIHDSDRRNVAMHDNTADELENVTVRLVYDLEMEMKSSSLLRDTNFRIFLCLYTLVVSLLSALVMTICLSKSFLRLGLDIKSLNDNLMLASSLLLLANIMNRFLKFRKLILYMLLWVQTFCASASSLILIVMFKVVCTIKTES